MITIINKYTGEVITKYSGALVSESQILILLSPTQRVRVRSEDVGMLS